MNKRNYPVREITDLRQMLRESAELFGDHAAFLVKQEGAYRPISFNRFRFETECLGAALWDLGLAGKRVIVIGENRYEWALSYMATVCGLGVIVPVDKEIPAEEIANIALISEAAAVLYSPLVSEKVAGIPCPVKISFEELPTHLAHGRDLIRIGSAPASGYLDAPIDPDALSVLLFTSGTTGVSKGVMLSQRNICFDLMQMCQMIYIGPEDTFLSVLPLHHTYECTCGFLCQIYRGSTIAYCEGLRYITKNMQEAKVTIMLCVPVLVESMYKKIWQSVEKKGKTETLKNAIALNNRLKKVGVDLSKTLFKDIHATFGGHLHLLICGGAAVDPEILSGLRDLGILAVQGYGLTECAPLAAVNRDRYYCDMSAGLCPPKGKLEIAHPDSDGTGEIRYKGDNVMLGYFNAPELTAESIRDGWFYTGDLGFLDEKGFLHITGRKKNVIVTANGKNVFPEELETYLNRSPYVKESVVIGIMNDKKRDYDIIAAVFPDEETFAAEFGADYTPEQVREKIDEAIKQVNDVVQNYKHINGVLLRKEEFPKNTSKKIKRYGIAEIITEQYLQSLTPNA